VLVPGQQLRLAAREPRKDVPRALALAEEALLTDWRQDIRQGPDGLLYVLADDDDGAILRIEPAL